MHGPTPSRAELPRSLYHLAFWSTSYRSGGLVQRVGERLFRLPSLLCYRSDRRRRGMETLACQRRSDQSSPSCGCPAGYAADPNVLYLVVLQPFQFKKPLARQGHSPLTPRL
jgi:hypothetical protein